MDNTPERHEFTSAGGHKHWIEIGKNADGKPWATNWSGSLSVPTVMADEVLRLATRLKEAEELLTEVDRWGDSMGSDFLGRLHAFLASGKERA